MKRACYFFSGREVWFHLPILLRENGIEPVLWLGHPIHDETVKETYPECELLDYMKTNKGVTSLQSVDSRKTNRNNPIPLEYIQSISFYKLKDKVIKMMDRQDDYLYYRRIDREAVFYSLFNYFYRKIVNNQIDILICSEAPHFPAEYMIYGLCEILSIPRIHFLPSSVAPFILIKKSINGDWVRLNTPSSRTQDLKRIMSEYVDSLQVSQEEIEEPDYMKKQKSFDEKLSNNNKLSQVSPSNLFQRIFRKLQREGFKSITIAILRIPILRKLLNSILIKNFKTKLGLDAIEKKINYKRWYTIQSLNLIEEPIEIIINDPESNKIKNKIKILQKSEYDLVSQEVSLETEYIYFPLHYEPERTTNPEGGDYYNAYDTLLALRSLIPQEIPIYVKEHYSQFSHALHGHRGRSHYFYRAILSIPNVVIVNINYSSIELIDNAELTASITGTACLEAACRGRKSLIFGNTWFSGCPNVYKFDQLNDYQELADAPISSSHQIKEYFNALIEQYAIVGCTNPGTETRYRTKYPDIFNQSFDEDMLKDIVSALSTLGIIEKDEVHQG